jgi:orotate phosphoribosyltransferase
VEWLRGATRGQAHDVLCGIETASLPLVGAYGLRYMEPTLYLRTRRKEYGARRILEGHYAPGARVLLVDDLIAEPAVTLEFFQLAREAGVEVVGLCVLFEKLHPRRSRDVLAADGVPITSLFTYRDVADVIRRHAARLGCDAERAELVLSFGNGDKDGNGDGGGP